PLRMTLEGCKGMLERHRSVLHPGLAAQIAEWPAAHQVVDSHLVECRIGIESQIAIHQAETASARHEAAHNRPGHGRRLGKYLGKIEACPDRAGRLGASCQRRDLFTPDLFTFRW